MIAARLQERAFGGLDRDSLRFLESLAREGIVSKRLGSSAQEQATEGAAGRLMTQLILKRAPVGDNLEDYSVLEDGAVVGRIFFLDAVGPHGRPWMWASGHSAGTVKRAAHGYAPTREEAMQAFARSWRRN
jgi:hypothetical protein